MARTAGLDWIEALRERQPWTENDARRVMDAWRESGDSIPAFARKTGLVASRLYWWRDRLGAAATTTIARAAQLVPVTVRFPEIDLPAARVEVLGDRVLVEVREADAATAAWVASLVRALRDPA